MAITKYTIINKSINKQSLYMLYNLYYFIAIIKGFTIYLYINKRLTLNSKLLIYYLSIPAYIALLMLISNKNTQYLFYFTDNEIIHGPLFLLIFLHYIAYTLAFTYFSIKRKVNYSKNIKTFIGLYFLYFIALSYIQITSSDIQQISLLSSLLLLFLFTILEAPLLQENKKMGTINRNSFDNYVKNLDTERVKFILIKIKSIEIINTFEPELNVTNGFKNAIKIAKKDFPKTYYYSLTSSIIAVAVPASIQTSIFINYLTTKLDEYKIIKPNASPLSFIFAESDAFQEFKNATSLNNAIKYGINLLENAKVPTKCFLLTQRESELYIRQQKIYKELHYSITQNQIELKIQPVYDVKKKTVLKGEVLARLQIPGIGYVPSEEFISMAEKNGTINEFGLSVFNELCHLLNTVKLPIEQLSFNISMFHFMQPSLPKDLLEIVTKNNIDPKLIIIEITETSKILDWEILKENMNLLKAEGFTLSLDDFGTGYASLEYFVSLPFDIIKFDRKLLLAAQDNEKALTALSSTIQMVRSLGFITVIEGVETEEQNKMAHDMKIDYIQGFLYGRPLNLSNFAKLVNKGD
jgi:EAL domain-containing protein (putative c-di-GMP-specific phosphodiesterase class I)